MEFSWAISNPGRWCCESSALNMPANLENSAVAIGLENVSFHSNPKERQCQRMLKLTQIALISHTSNAQNSPSQTSAIRELWTSKCSSRNSNTLATSCGVLTHWERLWSWEGLGAGGEGDDRGWDGWTALRTRWTWVWVNSGSWWWTGRPGVLHFMGSQRVGHNRVTELNWVLMREYALNYFVF